MQSSDLGLNLELKSGHPILEFTNTVGNHASDHPHETLFKYEDLLAWARKIGLLRNEKELARRAAAQPAEAPALFARALELREALYRIFVAQTRGKPPGDGDLSILNSLLAQAARGAQIIRRGGKFEWQWDLEEKALEAPLWILALSAVDLMTSEYYGRLGLCADEDGCGWLFVDTTRNHSRRWCDINDCGNRAKQRRYQQRARGSTG